MKFQVLVLLSLVCYSALSAITPVGDTVTLNGVTYAIGTEGDECGVQRTEGANVVDKVYTSGAAAGDCVPKGIFAIGSDVWVVFQVSAAGDILTAANAEGGVDTVYDEVIPAADTTADTVVIAKIIVAETDFGLFQEGSYLGTVDGSSAWGGFTISAVTSCDTTIEVTGDTANGFSVANSAGTAVSGATGTGVFLTFDTTNNAVSGSTTSTCDAAEEEEEEEEETEQGEEEEGSEEEEEEEEEGNNAAILSAASAILAFVGVVAL